MSMAAGAEIRWPVVWAALAGGVAAAMQLGKAAAVMPLLRAEFGIGLTAVSAYLAIISLGAAALGLVMGTLAQRVGVLRAGLAGLGLLAAASVAGALAGDWRLFVAARLVEALGLPLVVAAMPALIQAACGPARRLVGMGIWSAWMPLGVALAMFLSVPLAEAGNWRLLYALSGLMPALAAVALWASRPVQPPVPPEAAAGGLSLRLERPPARVLNMALAFLMFAGTYLTVTGFLPSVADSDLGMGLENAALLAGAAALLVVVGNLLATVLLMRGRSARAVLVAGLAGMAICATLFLLAGLPVWLRVLAGVAFHLAAGVVPGVIWSSVTILSQRLGMGAALISGVYYQAAGLGQLTAPVVAGAVVEASGSWLGILAVVLPFMALAMRFGRRGLG